MGKNKLILKRFFLVSVFWSVGGFVIQVINNALPNYYPPLNEFMGDSRMRSVCLCVRPSGPISHKPFFYQTLHISSLPYWHVFRLIAIEKFVRPDEYLLHQ